MESLGQTHIHTWRTRTGAGEVSVYQISQLEWHSFISDMKSNAEIYSVTGGKREFWAEICADTLIQQNTQYLLALSVWSTVNCVGSSDRISAQGGQYTT